jgi:acetyl-CoA carboxylase biotin carboxyl carrier protein
MDFKQIQELIKLVSKSGISEFSIENQEIKLKIKTGYTVAPQQINMPQMVMPSFQQQPVYQQISSAPQTEQSIEVTPEVKSNGGEVNYVTIKSPIVGTFYRSSGPDKDPFVKVGDDIEVGSVLCIIEAMKLFNEIESEFKGKIVKILVDDASPVEFDQPLFLIEPR